MKTKVKGTSPTIVGDTRVKNQGNRTRGVDQVDGIKVEDLKILIFVSVPLMF
jgi:hypothetical protein